MAEALFAFTGYSTKPPDGAYHTESEWEDLLAWGRASARGESTDGHVDRALAAEARALRAAGRAPRARATEDVFGGDGWGDPAAAWARRNGGVVPAALRNSL